MKPQNYSNHFRFVPAYHYFNVLGTLIFLIGSVVNLVKSTDDNLYDATLILFGALLLVFTTFFARSFSLKAQDRAIKAEENFRHYILTGKTMDSKLTVRQIIGLRFASDEEFPELAKKAIKENLTEKDIKKAIKNWKADNYRV